MIFGVTAFSQVPFSTLPLTGATLIGVSGMQLLAELTRVQVSTPFNINVDVNTTGNQLNVALNGLATTWVEVDTSNNTIWTQIIT
jgi:hypothetical protein